MASLIHWTGDQPSCMYKFFSVWKTLVVMFIESEYHFVNGRNMTWFLKNRTSTCQPLYLRFKNKCVHDFVSLNFISILFVIGITRTQNDDYADLCKLNSNLTIRFSNTAKRRTLGCYYYPGISGIVTDYYFRMLPIR